ncbi:MAG: GIN domain-containing protein [Labilibaculum antarcticum]
MANKTLILSLTLLIFCSCSQLNLFEEEGDYTETRFEFTAITQIKNLNTFTIEIVQDDEEYLLLKGGENVLKEATISFSDQEIILDHQYQNWTRNYDLITAEIHLKDLQTITIDSPAEISSNGTLNGDNLYIDITADAELVEMNLNLDYTSMTFHSHGSVSGGYEFAGICPLANYTLNGITNIKSSSLKSQTISLGQNGIGEAHVWAEEKLNVTIYNIGNIYYKGNPEVKITKVQVNNQSPTAKVLPE